MFAVKAGIDTAELENVLKSLSDAHYNGYRDGIRLNGIGDDNRNSVWSHERIDRQELIESVMVLSTKVKELEERVAAQSHHSHVENMRF